MTFWNPVAAMFFVFEQIVLIFWVQVTYYVSQKTEKPFYDFYEIFRNIYFILYMLGSIIIVNLPPSYQLSFYHKDLSVSVSRVSIALC